MKLNELQEILAGIKTAAYVSLVKSKDLGKGVTKITRMRCRLGVQYDNMKKVIERRNENLVGRDLIAEESPAKKSSPLPWGNWVTGYEKYIIEHKGNYYLRIAESYNMKAHPISQYYLNGVPVEKSVVENIIAPSKLKASVGDVYCVKLQDIINLEQKHKER